MRRVALLLEKEPPDASSRSARTMADTKSGGSGDQPAEGGPPRRRPDRAGRGGSAEAFDIWLQRGLHQLYDNVAKEPVPDELLKLIEQDRSDRGK